MNHNEIYALSIFSLKMADKESSEASSGSEAEVGGVVDAKTLANRKKKEKKKWWSLIG